MIKEAGTGPFLKKGLNSTKILKKTKRHNFFTVCVYFQTLTKSSCPSATTIGPTWWSKSLRCRSRWRTTPEPATTSATCTSWTRCSRPTCRPRQRRRLCCPEFLPTCTCSDTFTEAQTTLNLDRWCDFMGFESQKRIFNDNAQNQNWLQLVSP